MRISRQKHLKPMPDNFVPGPSHVICAKGKEAKGNAANKLLRSLVASHVEEYKERPTKVERTNIVSKILGTIKKEGTFVRKVSGQWYDVGDRNAREKIGQALRDHLHTEFRSSSKAKAIVRRGDRSCEAVTSTLCSSNMEDKGMPSLAMPVVPNWSSSNMEDKGTTSLTMPIASKVPKAPLALALPSPFPSVPTSWLPMGLSAPASFSCQASRLMTPSVAERRSDERIEPTSFLRDLEPTLGLTRTVTTGSSSDNTMGKDGGKDANMRKDAERIDERNDSEILWSLLEPRPIRTIDSSDTTMGKDDNMWRDDNLEPLPLSQTLVTDVDLTASRRSIVSDGSSFEEIMDELYQCEFLEL